MASAASAHVGKNNPAQGGAQLGRQRQEALIRPRWPDQQHSCGLTVIRGRGEREAGVTGLGGQGKAGKAVKHYGVQPTGEQAVEASGSTEVEIAGARGVVARFAGV